ncbi:MAG: hypothetical protein LH650_16460 [Chloroflexi bacterium]|nr:hypothetical protein [Chloroflexota bacterium]
MTTKTVKPESPGVIRLRQILARPREVGIIGAQAYWLGDIHGAPLGPESDRTLAPFAQALAMVGSGTDPATLAVWARLEDGDLYLVAEDDILVDMAEAAAGLPARPRVLRE